MTLLVAIKVQSLVLLLKVASRKIYNILGDLLYELFTCALIPRC